MDLFTPLTLGALQLSNRIVMAPMTRSRANSDAMPTDVMIDYYAQRAGAGAIISEGIAPSPEGLGYCRTPGIYNAAQIAAWSKVTAAVHAADGVIIAQIMHVGRVAHHHNKPAGSQTIAPSALRARGKIFSDEAGMVPFDEPRALDADGIAAVIDEYQQATANALLAGFDGVELHCGSGYLPAQFLSTGTNRRTDGYGGSVANRGRFVLEVLAAMVSVAGSGRVGLRICPDNPFNDLADDNPEETFSYLLEGASVLDLAYLHVIRLPQGRLDNIALGERFFPGRLIVNDSYDLEEACGVVTSGRAAAVSFGRAFIANPDLPERFRTRAPLADFDPGTLYTPGEVGYSDYPAMADCTDR